MHLLSNYMSLCLHVRVCICLCTCNCSFEAGRLICLKWCLGLMCGCGICLCVLWYRPGFLLGFKGPLADCLWTGRNTRQHAVERAALQRERADCGKHTHTPAERHDSICAQHHVQRYPKALKALKRSYCTLHTMRHMPEHNSGRHMCTHSTYKITQRLMYVQKAYSLGTTNTHYMYAG